MVDQAFREAKDSPLDDQRRNQFGELRVSLIGGRRLLVVERGPDSFEALLRGEAGEQAGANSYRGEKNLHGPHDYPFER